MDSPTSSVDHDDVSIDSEESASSSVVANVQLRKDIERLSRNDESLTALYISGKDLQEEEVEALTEAMGCHHHLRTLTVSSTEDSHLIKPIVETAFASNDRTLQYLHLANNSIGDDVAASIGKGLKSNTSLKWLVLPTNSIGSKGVEEIVDGLKGNKTVELVDLSGNRGIGLGGCKALAGLLQESTNLQSLRLNSCKLGNIGIRILAEEGLSKSRSLLELRLDSNGISDSGFDGLVRGISRNCTLCDLWVRFNDISRAGAESLECLLENVNYSLERVYWETLQPRESSYWLTGREVLGALNREDDGLSSEQGVCRQQRGRIDRLCSINRGIKRYFDTAVDIDTKDIPLPFFAQVLERVEKKPDLLFTLLRANNSSLFRERKRKRKRRSPQFLRY